MAAKKKTRKKTAKRKKDDPDILEDSGRDNSGRFVPGHTGIGGRPKGWDFRKALERHIEETGFDIDKAAAELAAELLKQGKAGDTQAARLWLDRCYGIQRQELDINQTTAVSYTSDEARKELADILRDGNNRAAVLREIRGRAGKKGNGTA